MINNDVLPVSRTRQLRKTNKDGKIHKKDGNIPIEMKKYKVNELSALRGKYAKVDVELSLDEEKDAGRSIMINLNTMLFEVSKQNLLQYLDCHPTVTSVNQTKSAKALTDEGHEADVEYHLDVTFQVKGKTHEVKLKLYTTNCRIHVQHQGKVECKQQEYLNNRSPPKYFAETIIIPFCKNAYDNLKDKEVEFVMHLRDEINRIVKEGAKGKAAKQKAPFKSNTREKCAAQKCKHKNVVVTKKEGKFGKCFQCDKVEHFDCVNANAFMIESIQKGYTHYYCTDCLMNNPVLGLEVTMDTAISGDVENGDQTSIELENDSEDTTTVNESTEVVKDIIIEQITRIEEQKEKVKCKECSYDTNVEKQMETHRRIKHIDIIKFACTKCDYNSSTKSNLEEHARTHQKEVDACEECEFVPQNEDQLKEHKEMHHIRVPYFNCGKCQFHTDSRTSLESHMESTHPEPTKSITCGICSKKLLPQEELDVHVYTHHKKMFKCGKCEYETEQQEELQKHVTEKHQGSGRCKTCPAFHTMEVKFKLLKENYERLITINKNLQDQAKDRGYAHCPGCS